MTTHRKFLDSCYAGMNGSNPEFEHLITPTSWKTVLAMVKQLGASNPSVSYSNFSDRLEKRRREVQFKALDELIKTAAGSADVGVQEKLVQDRLKKLNRGLTHTRKKDFLTF